jgi:hypothetical protein
MQLPAGPYVRITDVRDLITIMRRALRIGLFIGTLVGMSACASMPDDGSSRGAYGSVDAGRTD